jgi:hypothetical protein
MAISQPVQIIAPAPSNRRAGSNVITFPGFSPDDVIYKFLATDDSMIGAGVTRGQVLYYRRRADEYDSDSIFVLVVKSQNVWMHRRLSFYYGSHVVLRAAHPEIEPVNVAFSDIIIKGIVFR